MGCLIKAKNIPQRAIVTGQMQTEMEKELDFIAVLV
jgi:hypothetical protein